MAGLTMYAMKPVFELDAALELPSCMYSLPVIQSSVSVPEVSDTGSCPPGALQALEARQDTILARLERLKAEVAAYKKSLGLSGSEVESTSQLAAPTGKTPDLVVRCSPSHPAHSLQGVCRLLAGAGLSVHTSCHAHCSVSSLPPALRSFLPASEVSRSQAQVRITLIWKEVGRDAELMVSPLTQTLIMGEVNILRYISRLFPSVLPYESLSPLDSVDAMLDTIASLAWVAPRERQPLMRSLVTNLGKSSFLSGNSLSLTDLALHSVIKSLACEKELQPELTKWFAHISGHLGSTSSSSKKDKKAPVEKEKSPKKKDKSPVKELKEDKSPVKEKKKDKSPVKELKVEKNQEKKTGKQSDAKHFDKQKLFDYFTKNSISFDNIEHPEVFTVEAMLPYLKDVSGAICKNLFLKDKKKNLYLLSAEHTKEVKMNDVAKKIGAKELRFADESLLFDKLGVTQGCVTAYALVNNPEKDVKFIVDKSLVDGSHPKVNFHPLVNTATTAITSQDFKKFLKLTGHAVLEF